MLGTKIAVLILYKFHCRLLVPTQLDSLKSNANLNTKRKASFESDAGRAGMEN